MLLTLQVTVVFVVLVTEAENESVSPSNTLPEVGLMVTVMRGGGGVMPPPPPPPQAARHTLRARTKSAVAKLRVNRARRAVALWFDRVCGRGRMIFAKADRGPAQARREAGRGIAMGENLWEF